MERDQIPYFSKDCSLQCTTLDKGDTIIDAYVIPNIFNNCFAAIAKTT